MKTIDQTNSYFSKYLSIFFTVLFISSSLLKANDFSGNTLTIYNYFAAGNLGDTIKSIHSNFSDISALYVRDGVLNDDDIYWVRDNLTNLRIFIVTTDATVQEGLFPEDAFLNHPNLYECFLKPVTVIGANAFKGCSNLSTYYSDQLNQIGDSAFAGCTNFWKIRISAPEPPAVGTGVFNNCHFYRQFRLPFEGKIACQAVDDGNTNDNYWYGFELVVPFENNVTIDYGFTTGRLSKTVSAHRSDLSAITKLLITEGVLNNTDVYWIRDNLPNLEFLTIDEDATFSTNGIPDNAFKNHPSLQFIFIPNAPIVGDNAFEQCVNLVTVDLSSATTLGDYAFKNCFNCSQLYLNKNTPPLIGTGTFDGCTAEGRIIDLNSQSDLNAYRAIDDGNTNDNYWYGWEIEGGGSTVIRVNTDEGGNLDWGVPSTWDTIYENVNGAFFWNGEDWMVNDTYGHMYFEDTRVGGMRIGNYGGVDYLIPTDTTIDNGRTIGGYTIAVEEYQYSVMAKDSGTYTYTGIKYSIFQPDGTTIELYSRGNGNGADSAYFDVVLKDTSPGPGITTFKEGGIVSDATGFTMFKAIENSIIDSLVKGRLVTTDLTNHRNRYFIDTNGGNEMGGMSYILETQRLPPPNTIEFSELCRTYISEFAVHFKNDYGQLESFKIVPLLLSETYIPPTVAGNKSIYNFTDSRLVIYPNPTTDILKFKCIGTDMTTQLSVYDMNGRVKIAKNSFSANNIDVTSLNPGVYFLVIETKEKKYRARFIKK